MVDEKISIIVELKDNASKAVKGIQDGFDKLGTTAKLVAAAGIGLIAKTLYDCVKAFGEGETATKGLESALKSTGQEVKNNTKNLTAFAQQMMKVTTLDDDAIVGLLKMGVGMGLTADKAKQLTQEAIGLSGATGTDLESAFRMVTAAGNGNYTMMQRAIPTLRGITDQSILAAKAQEIIAAGFQMAQDKTKTFEGSMLQLHNSINEAQKSIGAVFAPAVQAVADVIKNIVNWFNELDPAMKKNVVIIGTLSAVVVALIPVLGVLASAVAAISWPVIAVVAAVAGLTAGFLILRNEVKAVGGVGNLIKNIYLSWFQLMLEGFQQILIAAKKFIDLLNKIPGVHIPIDEAIAGIDELQKKLEDHKAKRQEDNTQELEETKTHEENKLAIKQTAQANEDEWKAAIDEADKAKKAADDQAFIDRLLKMSDAEIKQANLTQQQISAIQALKNKQLEDQSKAYIGFIGQAADKEKDIGKAVAQGTLDYAKQSALAWIDTEAAKQVAAGAALLPLVFVGDPEGPLRMAAGALMSAAGHSLIGQIQLAEGGIVMPQPGGVSATIAEAGQPEAVIPLDSPQAQGMMGGNQNITVNISGKPLAKEMYEIQQEMIRTGELSA